MNIIFTFVLFLFGAVACIWLHELGHYLCARLIGIQPIELSFGQGRMIASKRFDRLLVSLHVDPLGGFVETDPKDDDEVSCFLIAFAGPFTSLFLCILSLYVMHFTADGAVHLLAAQLSIWNTYVFLNNMLPDGGDGKIVLTQIFGAEFIKDMVEPSKLFGSILRPLTWLVLLLTLCFSPS